jgi:hypothetical protein
MVMVARAEFAPGPVPPMALGLAAIAETLLDHERRLRDEEALPTVTPPLYTPAELLAIEAGASREGPGPSLHPDAARPLAFVAALMARGVVVEVDVLHRTVTASAAGLRRKFAWGYLDACGVALHKLAAEVAADFEGATR